MMWQKQNTFAALNSFLSPGIPLSYLIILFMCQVDLDLAETIVDG